jgi:serine/threonine-protein kinase RsbW
VRPQDKTHFELELASNPKEIIKVEKFLEKLNDSLKLEETKYNKLLVAVTEAVNNGMIHGNKRDPKKKVILRCDVKDGQLFVYVHDEGPGVDPDSLPDPLAEENLLRENGRGVFLMRSLMDKVTYEQTPTGCAVTMMIGLDA